MKFCFGVLVLTISYKEIGLLISFDEIVTLDWQDMEIPSSSNNRSGRYMLEGVGTRVIRGPDWKWGKQVSLNESTYTLVFVSSKFVNKKIFWIFYEIYPFRMVAKVTSEPYGISNLRRRLLLYGITGKLSSIPEIIVSSNPLKLSKLFTARQQIIGVRELMI